MIRTEISTYPHVDTLADNEGRCATGSHPRDDWHWYVLHTKSKQEFRALDQLHNQNYECFLPTISIQKVARRRVALVREPLFSRYLFIRLSASTSNWAPIRSTRGVSQLLTFGERYATISDDYIAAVRQHERQHAVPLFDTGEAVKITEGPLAGLEAIYQMQDGDARAVVLIEFMSRTHKLSMGVAALRKAG